VDPILEWGIEFIVAIQTIRSPALDAFFQGVTFLGNAEFYLLLAPIFIWSVNYRLGARLGILLLLSAYINQALKELFMQPRPCEPRPDVCIDQADSYGLPSGHAQNAIVFWGVIAQWIGTAWAWIAAILLMLLIGISRIYLGVHFPTDVFVGWAIGIVILGIYIVLGERVEKWLGGALAGGSDFAGTRATGAVPCEPAKRRNGSDHRRIRWNRRGGSAGSSVFRFRCRRPDLEKGRALSPGSGRGCCNLLRLAHHLPRRR